MGSLRAKVTEIEKEEITRALTESNWIMARAARLLGITERMIGYKIKKYGIRKEGGRSSKEVQQRRSSVKNAGFQPDNINKGGNQG